MDFLLLLETIYCVAFPPGSYMYSRFQNITNSMRHHCLACMTTSEALSDICSTIFIKMISVQLMYFCFPFYFLLLCTIARNCGIFDPALIFDSESFLWTLYLRQVCLSGSERPCIQYPMNVAV